MSSLCWLSASTDALAAFAVGSADGTIHIYKQRQLEVLVRMILFAALGLTA